VLGVLVAVAAVASLAVGCSGSEQVATGNGEATGAAMRSYNGTAIAPGPMRLLKVDEVRPLISFGYDIRDQPVLDPKQFSLTSVRGPCGAAVATPFRPDGGFRILRSTITLIIEALAEPGVVASRSLVEQLQADLKPGCPDFDEQVGGGTAKVHLERELSEAELPTSGEHRVGWLQKITAPDGKVGYRIVVFVSNGTRVLMLAVLTTERPNTAQLADLVRLAATAS
jgi:hypothetical protein